MTDIPVAIVTGAAQGLGAAICIELLKEGYKVCVTDIQDVKGKNFVKELQAQHGSGNIIFYHCDVTKDSDYERAFDDAIKAFGKVDVLVNNAGISEEQSPLKTLQVNLMGPLIGCQKALKYMGKTNRGKGGVVISISSLAGFLPMYVAPAYAASKHGVVGLTRSYGRPYHLERDGVIFMALCPCFIDTDFLKSSKTNTLVPGFDFCQFPNMKPQYAARGVVKLLEDRINGSTLVVFLDRYEYVGYQEELKKIPLD